MRLRRFAVIALATAFAVNMISEVSGRYFILALVPPIVLFAGLAVCWKGRDGMPYRLIIWGFAFLCTAGLFGMTWSYMGRSDVVSWNHYREISRDDRSSEPWSYPPGRR